MQAVLVIAFCALFSFAITGCRFFSGDTPQLVNDNYPIAYVKRVPGSEKNPLDIVQLQPGSDLYIRDIASPEANERNITGILTKGLGDISDPEPSYDGKTIIFSLRCTNDSAGECASDETWNIWTYNIESKQLKSVISDFTVRNMGDDLDPAFLPDGRIIFISTRQQASQDKLGYKYVGSGDFGPSTLLHVMNADGSNIQQISFNQSNDRNPVVLANGKIMFSRWSGEDESKRYSLFTIKPDGTDLSSFYGAHSPGDIFLHARELKDGRVVSTVMPSKSQWAGGALMLLDVENFSDVDMAAPWARQNSNSISGQQSATQHEIPIDSEISRYGRFSKAFPLPDGSGDVLVSYSLFNESVEVNLNNNVELLDRTHEEAPKYGLYKLNINDKNMEALSQADEDYIYTDPISLMPRDKPDHISAQVANNPSLFNSTTLEGIVNIKSVYDTDVHEYMGPKSLTVEERAMTPIPQTSPSDPTVDNRESVANISMLKSGSILPSQRPAWFLRVVQAQLTPPGVAVSAKGNLDYGMRRLLGYAPIEADGSVRIKVPANSSFTLSVVDRYGRAFSQQSSWLQVLPGTTLQCKGCHAPRDTASINPSSIAETQTGADSSRLVLTSDMKNDEAGVLISYSSLSNPPTNGVIDYVENIQPIFEQDRVNGSCVSCHDGTVKVGDNPSGLDLKGTGVGADNAVSYEQLLKGRITLDANGVTVVSEINGIMVPKRELPLVTPGFARKSYFIEKIFNQELFAERGLPQIGLDHSLMLNEVEKRLLSEWIDMGAQYINSAFDELGNIQSALGDLSYPDYIRTVATALINQCASCHNVINALGEANPNFVGGDFEMYGSSDVNFQSVKTFVTDYDFPENSLIISVPMNSTIHPVNDDGTPYLSPDMVLYKNLVQWISEGKQNAVKLTSSVPYAVNRSQ